MDNDNKVFNSMDEVSTNCSWFRFVESNRRRITKIEKKMDAMTLKNTSIIIHIRIVHRISKFFGKVFEKNSNLVLQN
jgi:hypothetical protein